MVFQKTEEKKKKFEYAVADNWLLIWLFKTKKK